MTYIKNIAVMVWIVLVSGPLWAADLVMVDETGCVWCQRWTDEIAPIYPKTTEGKYAPLRRINVSVISDEVVLARRVGFTPTFLLVEDGAELARIEGYPGEDFFWPLLERMLRTHTNYGDENG
jgi:hypothetical protein